jgi:hypothetical protein
MGRESFSEFMAKSLTERRDSAEGFKRIHSSKVPVIVRTGKEVTPLDNCKYSIKDSLTVNALMQQLRGDVKAEPHEAYFLLVLDGLGGEVLLSASQTMGQLWQDYPYTDGFLHVILLKENVFGH